MGTSFGLTVSIDDKERAKAAEIAALEEIERLSSIFNLYDSESEVSLLNRSESMNVSVELFEVLESAERWRNKTKNTFSARIGSILETWKIAREEESLPHRPTLRVKAEEIRKAKVLLSGESRSVVRPSSVKWATDGIAKGYIIDKAFAAALSASPDVEGMLLDIGGDIRLHGHSANGQPWKVGVSKPESGGDIDSPHVVVELSEGAIATSGHSARSFEIDGVAYSHILDTKSGWPVAATHSATVIAADAETADVLATTFTAMNAAACLELAESLVGIECLIYGYDGRRYSSSGWSERVVAPNMDHSDPLWLKGYALSVDYEVPKIKVSKYRAPYVSIWVTDANRKLVKSLLMLGDNPRWTEENYVWWRRYARKAPTLVDAISQPSREPGKYTLVWDGTDDFGNFVPQGNYVLNVEASREHGGHTLARIDLALFEKKQRVRRKPEGELGAIHVEFNDKS